MGKEMRILRFAQFILLAKSKPEICSASESRAFSSSGTHLAYPPCGSLRAAAMRKTTTVRQKSLLGRGNTGTLGLRAARHLVPSRVVILCSILVGFLQGKWW